MDYLDKLTEEAVKQFKRICPDAEVKTYGESKSFDSEEDMYEYITGHRPSWEKDKNNGNT